MDVAGGPPEVADRARPGRGIAGEVALLAQRVDDGAPAGGQGVAHGPVAGHGGGGVVAGGGDVAVVVLEVVHAPGGPGPRVLHLVAQAAREAAAGAGVGAGIAVDAQLQAPGMDVVGGPLDAVGELAGVGHQVAMRVPAPPGPPAVVVAV